MHEWRNCDVRRRSSVAVDADDADEIQPLLQGIDQLQIPESTFGYRNRQCVLDDVTDTDVIVCAIESVGTANFADGGSDIGGGQGLNYRRGGVIV